MSTNELMVEVAKLCGWKNVEWYDGDNSGPGYWHGIPPITEEEAFKLSEYKLNSLRKHGTQLPNYPEDLNACAEFEAKIENKRLYIEYLVEQMKRGEYTVMASAEKRCLAFRVFSHATRVLSMPVRIPGGSDSPPLTPAA